MDAFTFVASLDSKGRITVPSEVRKKYGLEKSDTFRISLESIRVETIEVASINEAKEALESFNDIVSFSYTEGVLKVVIDG